jgi:hypothetical protein
MRIAAGKFFRPVGRNSIAIQSPKQSSSFRCKDWSYGRVKSGVLPRRGTLFRAGTQPRRGKACRSPDLSAVSPGALVDFADFFVKKSQRLACSIVRYRKSPKACFSGVALITLKLTSLTFVVSF